MIEIIALSLIQGITEFLPISSSSHLIIVSEYLMTISRLYPQRNKKFQYHLPLEIINEHTPETWKNKLI